MCPNWTFGWPLDLLMLTPDYWVPHLFFFFPPFFYRIAIVPDNLGLNPFEDVVWEQTASKEGFTLLRKRHGISASWQASPLSTRAVRAREMEHKKKKRGQRQVENIMLQRDSKFLPSLQNEEFIRNPDERKLIIKVCREAGLICMLICK